MKKYSIDIVINFSYFQAIVAIGNETDNEEFIFCDSDLAYDEGLDLDPCEYEVKAQEREAKELKRRHELLMQVGYCTFYPCLFKTVEPIIYFHVRE